MSDFPRDRAATARGLRIGVVSVLVALAFLIGLALAVVLVRRQPVGPNQAAAAGQPSMADPTAPLAAPTVAPLAPSQTAVPAQPLADPNALAARQAALAGQIATLEARATALAGSATAAGGQAARAEALLTTVAARRALERGLPLGALDPQLAARFGVSQPRPLAAIREAARQPVTLEELRQGLDALGPVLATGANRGWLESLRQELRTLVVLRRAGTPSPLPADRLARARRQLDMGQVEAARAEVARLPGAGQAGNWLAAARRYVLAHQALDQLELAALGGQAQPAPLAVPR
jgi:hypothetical protein